MDRNVPKYFVNIMYSWFEKGCTYVRWGNAISFTFAITAGVRQGGLLSPLLLAVYKDVLIDRLQLAGIGCKLAQRLVGVSCMLTILCWWRSHALKCVKFVTNLPRVMI